HRDPQILTATERSGEFLRRNSDHDERDIVDTDRLADDFMIRSEMIAPHRVAQHRNILRLLQAILLKQESPSPVHRNAERLKILARNEYSPGVLSESFKTEMNGILRHRDDAAECFRVLGEVAILRQRQSFRPVNAPGLRKNLDDVRRIF